MNKHCPRCNGFLFRERGCLLDESDDMTCLNCGYREPLNQTEPSFNKIEGQRYRLPSVENRSRAYPSARQRGVSTEYTKAGHLATPGLVGAGTLFNVVRRRHSP